MSGGGAESLERRLGTRGEGVLWKVPWDLMVRDGCALEKFGSMLQTTKLRGAERCWKAVHQLLAGNG